MKISPPNYTQTPNILFDEWLPLLKEIELKVLLVIMRKTFGWHKTRDKISLSQLEKLTGSSQSNVKKAVDSLIEKKLISKEVVGDIGTQKTYYELVIEEDSNNSDPSQFKGGTPDNLTAPPPDNLSGTKETISKEKSKEIDLIDAIEIFDFEGKKKTCTKDDLFFISQKFNFDWTAQEIQFAFNRLAKHKGNVRDLSKFISAIIDKERSLEKIKQNQKKETKCSNPEKKIINECSSPHLRNQSEISNSETSGNVTSGQVLAKTMDFLRANRIRFQGG